MADANILAEMADIESELNFLKGPHMIIDLFFKKHIGYLNIESIKKSNDVIYIVDERLILRAYNLAWMNFAKNNNGEIILAKYSTGSTITNAFAGPLKSYLTSAYKKALNENKPFEHDYECSSANEYRLLHQTAYPLLESKGLVISNHMVKECLNPEEEPEFRKQFVNEEGFVNQCPNCLKIRDPNNNYKWIWAPSLVEKPFPESSHNICPQCYDHYYPKTDDDEPMEVMPSGNSTSTTAQSSILPKFP